MDKCIGMFGTCSKSTWRKPFIKAYDKQGITFFNPQKENWQASHDASIEARHLANDAIILFPVTDETYAAGSLAEIGFSILHAIRPESQRDFVIMVAPFVKPELEVANPMYARDSNRARALVIEHLRKLRLTNLFVVENLDDMLSCSLVLWKSLELKMPMQMYKLKDNP